MPAGPTTRSTEEQRLQQLRDLLVLDTDREPLFDTLVSLASQVCNVPIALVSLVDEERQWFKAEIGLPGVRETPREHAFCAHAIQGEGLMQVPDAHCDPRFEANPLVTGQPHIRFYAGVPMVLPEGARLGTLCVIDRQPRQLDDAQAAMLRQLAQAATQALLMRRDLMRRALQVRSQYEHALAEQASLLRRAGQLAGVGGWELDLRTHRLRWTEATARIHEVAPGYQPTLAEAVRFYAPEAQPVIERALAEGMAHGTPWDVELPLVTARGRPIWVRALGEVEFEDDRAVRLVGAFQDVTDMRAARQELGRLNREQMAMLDNDVVGIVKLRNRVSTWHNRALCLMFGYEDHELAGQGARLLYADDESFERVGADAYPLLQQGRHYRAQVPMQRKDGVRLWVDLNGVMLAPETGESMWLMTDITTMKLHQEQVEHIAFHDGLTGLPNRLLLADRIKSAMAVDARLGRSMAVCYLDLDGFKAVNDLHGHAAGDRLLREIAARLQGCLRETDTVARMGGDEFVIVLTPMADAAEADAVLLRVGQALRQPVDLGGGITAQVSSSIGVACFPGHASKPNELLKRADEAMYAAKARGKGQVVTWSDALRQGSMPLPPSRTS